jgi:hypothetical protein
MTGNRRQPHIYLTRWTVVDFMSQSEDVFHYNITSALITL